MPAALIISAVITLMAAILNYKNNKKGKRK